jgi:phosphopantetheine--protein transferase-like protein
MHDQSPRTEPEPAAGRHPPGLAARSALIGPRCVPAPADRPVLAAGVDLVDIDRLALAIERSGDRLVRRLFDADERDACAAGEDRQATAGLFGIKEAVVKVVGGLSDGARYADISIGATGNGIDNPAWHSVELRGELARWAEAHHVEVIAGTAPLREGLRLSWALALPLEGPC